MLRETVHQVSHGSFHHISMLGSILPMQRTLQSLRDTPTHGILIGCGEGLTATWLLLYLQTSILCMDTFEDPAAAAAAMDDANTLSDISRGAGGRQKLFLANVGFALDRVQLRGGVTSSQLFSLPQPSYDWVCIDVTDSAADTLANLVLAFHLVRPGGFLMLNDYTNSASQHNSDGALVCPGAAAFLQIFQHRVRVLTESAHLHLQKLSLHGPIGGHQLWPPFSSSCIQNASSVPGAIPDDHVSSSIVEKQQLTMAAEL
jgi:Methyltransferase domain